ncbi:MAG: hypothetical protein IKZ29_01950 [Clostridiales bacterium]|nr:hypothetical protein [Clostridiales bacterium]MBR4947303.1 hypothetical protein [Clostridiales bacterium]
MAVLKAVKDFFVHAFKYPKPFNWGYPVFFGSCGLIFTVFLSKLMFAGAFPFSSTSLIGCAVIVLLLVMFAFLVPSVLMAEKGGLDITGRYTGIGALILAFLSGAPLYLVKAAFHNISLAFWLKNGGSVIFPAAFYQLEEVNGLTLSLSILIDTVVPAFGISFFFLGAVWQGFNEKRKRWAFIVIPLLIALYSFDFIDLPAILIIGWWLCILRSRTENIYGPVLALLGARFTGILIGSVVIEIDLTTVRTFSDIPTTFYYSSIPAIVVAVILLAFFRKTLGEFHNSYSNDVYGDSRLPAEKDGGKANKMYKGFNLTLVLGIAICVIFWILIFKGARI